MSRDDGQRVAITGAGAVSPAGWGLAPLLAAVEAGQPLPSQPFGVPNSELPPRCRRRTVPKPSAKLPFLRDPRLRRTSPAGRFLAAAAIEAMGDRRAAIDRLAVIVSSYTGSINYSNRFYGEVLADPATASPILFPETVFNAPASHLSALFGSDEINYTLVGDGSQHIAALELASRWLLDGVADAVLVAAAEECDWLSAEALALFGSDPVVGEGAAALLLERSTAPEIEVERITDLHSITRLRPRAQALRAMREQVRDLTTGTLFESVNEGNLWQDWSGDRVRIRDICGEGFAVSAAWSSVAAYAALQSGKTERAVVSGAGINQACAAAAFIKNT